MFPPPGSSALRTLLLSSILLLAPSAAAAQAIAAPRPSVLFRQGAPVAGGRVVGVVADTMQDLRIANALLYGALGLVIGGLFAGDADGGPLLPRETIPIFVVSFAAVGYFFTGRTTE